MPREAKHLRVRETHAIARAQITSAGRTNNATRSKTLTASRNAPNSKIPTYIFRTNEQCATPQNAPNSKHPNYICWTNEQCLAKQNIYVSEATFYG